MKLNDREEYAINPAFLRGVFKTEAEEQTETKGAGASSWLGLPRSWSGVEVKTVHQLNLILCEDGTVEELSYDSEQARDADYERLAEVLAENHHLHGHRTS